MSRAGEGAVAPNCRRPPAAYLVFDILVDEHRKLLTRLSLLERREYITKIFKKTVGRRSTRIRLSPATSKRSEVQRWMRELGSSGLDGVVAKRADEPYQSAERTMH